MNIGAVSSVSLCNRVNFQGRSAEMSEKEKQELILKARTKAAGWAVFGGTLSTLYYALRSDEKVAKKFDLDVNEDRELVKQIKREQIKWTIPSAIGDIIKWGAFSNLNPKKAKRLNLAISVGAYLYNKCFAKAGNINLE